MLLYCTFAILSMIFGSFSLLACFVFPAWWIYLLVVIFFFTFFYSFFLLILENNNYKAKYYYSKKKFKLLYNRLIEKYNITSKKHKKMLKREAQDLFYQTGNIDEKFASIKFIIMDNWLTTQTFVNYEDCTKEEKLDYLLYLLMGAACYYDMYKQYLNNFQYILSKDELEELMNNCDYITDSFKDNILFVYDSPYLASENFLNDMYIELKYVIEARIGLVSLKQFKEAVYNPSYYYSKNKRVAYMIKNKGKKYYCVEINIEEGTFIDMDEMVDSKEEAIEIIKKELREYEEYVLESDIKCE